MSYDALAVANYFLDLARLKGDSLTSMKLQKLIYFAHGWSLAISDSPLIDETIEAWGYGPVVSSVYEALKSYGGDPIPETVKIDGSDLAEASPGIPLGDEHDFTRNLLQRIWEVYGELTAVQLSNLTHLPDTPWSIVAPRYRGRPPKKVGIPDSLIRGYFVDQAERD